MYKVRIYDDVNKMNNDFDFEYFYHQTINDIFLGGIIIQTNYNDIIYRFIIPYFPMYYYNATDNLLISHASALDSPLIQQFFETNL